MNTARMSASGTRFGLVIMAAELARPAMTAAERRGTTVSAIATAQPRERDRHASGEMREVARELREEQMADHGLGERPRRADRHLERWVARLPRELPFEAEPAHIFSAPERQP